MAALDGGNAAQEFVRGNLRIVMVERIPPGDPIGDALVDCPLDHAVGKQEPLPGKQNDIAWKRLGGTAPAHGKDVTRPDGGQHAGAGGSQAQLPDERSTSAANSHPSVSRAVLQAVTSLLMSSYVQSGTQIAWSAIYHRTAPWFQRPARSAPQVSGRAFAPPAAPPKDWRADQCLLAAS